MASLVNETIVKQYQEDLNDASGIILTQFQGVGVSDIDALRRELEGVGSRYRVFKNRLAKVAFKGTAFEGLENDLKGSTAAIVIKGDIVEASKVVKKYTKQVDALSIKSGCVEGQVLSQTEIEAIASIPPREVLIAKMLMCLNAPISGLVNVLSGVMRNTVGVINAIKEKKEKDGE